MYEIYEQLLQKHGVTSYRVHKDTGIAQSVLSAWKNGASTPKQDKLKIIADYFGVTVDYLMGGKGTEYESTSGKKYYFDDNTAEAAQELFDNPDTRALMDASRGVSPENIRLATEMLKRLKETNPDG